MLDRVLGKFRPRQEFVEADGSILPARDSRFCGPEFKDDKHYIQSAEYEAVRLIEHFGCDETKRVVDVGCGQGRLAIGLTRKLPKVTYTGIDIHEGSIDWCKTYIEARHPTFSFEHLNIHNERYNAEGVKLEDGYQFNFETGSIDIVYLFSVFSHTTEEDMRIYLHDFKRMLNDSGGVFFTTFVEDDVDDFAVNPEGYRLNCSGPLHVVRYRREYLFEVLGEIGFEVFHFGHATEADGQSALYLRVANSSPAQS